MKQSRTVLFSIFSFCLLNHCGILLGQTADTVIVPLATSSKIIFTLGDRQDLDQLHDYDYESLFEDILDQLEDRIAESKVDEPSVRTDTIRWEDENEEDDSDDRHNIDWDDDDWDNDDEPNFWKNQFPNSLQMFSFDFGINNYLEDGHAPDGIYTVHPWGSWNIALNAGRRIRFGSHFAMDANLGFSWYNFKFDKDNTHLVINDDGISFIPDPRPLDFTKSKLTVSYVNLTVVPMYTSGSHCRNSWHWHYTGSNFRIGVGPYVGYRLASHTKLQYEEHGDKHNEKEHDHFYLKNLRYGLRFQLGLWGTDLYFNYDLNTLFLKTQEPKLNAYSFGITF